MQEPPSHHGWPSFRSFVMGGFESATHRRRDGIRIDVAVSTSHDDFAEADYNLLKGSGICTVRDSLRWHVIEQSDGSYDWSTFKALLKDASAADTQIIWDLCHWGYPKHLDIFSEEFVRHFALFAAAADRVHQDHNRSNGIVSPTFYCPINEISFWAWVGGDEQHFDPYGAERGPELKEQLTRAAVAATRAIRAQNPAARFVQAEPIIHIAAEKEEDVAGAAGHTESQFEAWDMIAGISSVDVGGSNETLDIIGVNYYWNNQWMHEGDRTPPGHEYHMPLHRMLQDIWQRYGRAILITETGVESGAEFGWVGYVASEVRQAHRLGVPVFGICLYPVMDYPGWDDERHCACGLIEVDDAWLARTVRWDLADEVRLQSKLLQESLSCAIDSGFAQRTDPLEVLGTPVGISAS